MTAKKDCTKIICPLCERKCQAGSTSSGLIENNGACLRCVLGKTQEQIDELIAAKGKNAKLKNNIKKGVLMGLDLGTKEKKSLIAIKNNCIQNVDVAELNSVEIDNSCACAACQHRRNSDEMKIKSPAIFEGYEVSKTFIRNENAYICDGGYAEEVTIKKTWQKPDGSAWVTFLSNMRMGFLDMQLADFAKKYKAKPVEADEPSPTTDDTFNDDTPAQTFGDIQWNMGTQDRTEEVVVIPCPKCQKAVPYDKHGALFLIGKQAVCPDCYVNNKVVGSTPASDGKRYFYITFSCNGGGKKGAKRGYICIKTFGNKIFSIERLSKNIKEILLIKGQRVKDVLITDWKEVNQIDYNQLTDNENETPCKLL